MEWTPEVIGTAIGVGAIIIAAGKVVGRVQAQDERIQKLEDQLSWSGPEGPAFVHRALFDLQNDHNEAMVAELKESLEGVETRIGGLEDKLEEKINETNRLLETLIAQLVG